MQLQFEQVTKPSEAGSDAVTWRFLCGIKFETEKFVDVARNAFEFLFVVAVVDVVCCGSL